MASNAPASLNVGPLRKRVPRLDTRINGMAGNCKRLFPLIAMSSLLHRISSHRHGAFQVRRARDVDAGLGRRHTVDATGCALQSWKVLCVSDPGHYLHVGFRGWEEDLKKGNQIHLHLLCQTASSSAPTPLRLYFRSDFRCIFSPRLPELLTSSPAPTASLCFFLSLLIVSSKDTTLASISPC